MAEAVSGIFAIEDLETRVLLSEFLSTFAPTLPRVVRPSDNPALPSAFDRFLPPGRTGRADDAAPDVAEWTKTGRPGDSLVLTADQLSVLSGDDAGSDTGFVVYGQTRLRRGVLTEAEIHRVDGQVAGIRLDEALPARSMYFVWPRNGEAVGDPVAVNRTEAWWVGPNRAVAGETISVYGRNLSHDGGTSVAWVYIKPTGDEAGQWAQVTGVNPYKVDFVVPASLAAGSYEVWVHNGHGGNYGWSAPLAFSVRGDGKWDGPHYNVRDYGAKGDGSTDDFAAIAKVMEKAASHPGSTIVFPAGTYRISDGFQNTPANVRWIGAGKDLTVIKPIDDYRKWALFFDQVGEGSEIRDMTLDATAHTEAQIGILVRTGATQDVRFENMGFLGPNAWLNLEFGLGKRITVRNSEVIGRGIHVGVAKQIFIDRVNIYGTRDTNILIWSDGGSEISVTNSTGQDYDNSNPNSGQGWAQGRFYAGSGWGESQSHIYLGGNRTTDLGVRPGLEDQNSGEQFMWELNLTQLTKRPTNASLRSVTFAGLEKLKGDRVTVVGGRGIGQYRRIVDFDRATGRITLDRPWDVIPDERSMVSVGYLSDRVVVHGNFIDGKAEQVTQATHTASSGVNLFGASVEFIVDGNVMTDVRHGIYNWMTDDGVQHHPFFSNLFINNTIQRTRQAISIHAAGIGDDGAVAYLGNIYRDNLVSDALQHGLYMRSIGHGNADANMNVFERNTIRDTPLGMRLDRHRGNLRNTIIQRNTFARGFASWEGSYGYILFNVRDSLIRGNRFEWFETTEALWGELYIK